MCASLFSGSIHVEVTLMHTIFYNIHTYLKSVGIYTFFFIIYLQLKVQMRIFFYIVHSNDMKCDSLLLLSMLANYEVNHAFSKHHNGH